MQSCWQNNSSASCFSLGKSSFGTQLVLLKKILLKIFLQQSVFTERSLTCIHKHTPDTSVDILNSYSYTMNQSN